MKLPAPIPKSPEMDAYFESIGVGVECRHETMLKGIGGRTYCGDCRNLKCSFCDTIDGAVGSCGWCFKQVCLEHDDVLENRGIDAGLTLCQPCGDAYDNQHGVKYDDR